MPSWASGFASSSVSFTDGAPLSASPRVSVQPPAARGGLGGRRRVVAVGLGGLGGLTRLGRGGLLMRERHEGNDGQRQQGGAERVHALGEYPKVLAPASDTPLQLRRAVDVAQPG